MCELQDRTKDTGVQVTISQGLNADLSTLIAEVRAQYEAIAAKSRQEVECWFKGKVCGKKESFILHHVITKYHIYDYLQNLNIKKEEAQFHRIAASSSTG